jgi:predicted nucleic acid-binding protein
MYLVDTCVLVDHLRGYPPAHDWLRKCIEEDPVIQFYYSAITVAELFAGLPQKQETPVLRLLGIMNCLEIDAGIAQTAGGYVRKWRPSHGVEIPDALLAATAKKYDFTLVTLNQRHFPMEDIKLLVPYFNLN